MSTAGEKVIIDIGNKPVDRPRNVLDVKDRI
jgi:hypothetical protein